MAPPTSAVAQDDRRDDALARRIEKLTADLEAARAQYHVPGLAIAVVHDGEVVLATGLGKANLERGTPVTKDTVFSIGSSTKAFSSTLVGMMVDEGKLAWDDSISKHVPELALPELTIRDGLAHRTGFTRMSLLWISGAVDRPEMFRQASHAERWSKHREKFLYNNVMYAAASETAARVSGKSWEVLLRERLLDPLGMKTTTVDPAIAEKDPRRAQGYTWRSEAERFDALPMRGLEAIGPSGAIMSNVDEMARWVQFQLAGGEVNGKRLISAEALAETRKAQTKIGQGTDYGLGWMLAEHEGKAVVHHGGNIDGYAAMVAMIPEEKLGFVLLTNVTSTPLQNASLGLVFSAMLDDLDAEAAPREDFSKLTGTYIATFGSFKADPLEVTARGGKLFVDVPRQMNFELKPPDAEGRRAFAITDTIAVSFVTGDDGKVDVMRLHQGGLDFEAFRRGYVPPPEVPLADLERYRGAYSDPELGTVKVLVQNNRLAVDIPKQMIYELYAPDADGKWAFRVKRDIAVSFAGPGASTERMTLYQNGKTREMKRDPRAKVEVLPTVDDVLKLRNNDRQRDALAKLGVIEVTGKVRMPSSVVEGTITIHLAADGRYASTIDFGKYGVVRTVVHADGGWSDTTFSPGEEHMGKFLAQARVGHPLALFSDWRQTFDAIDVKGTRTIAGRRAIEVALRKGELPAMEVLVDAKTGEPIEGTQLVLTETAGGLATQVAYEGTLKLGALRLPRRYESSNEPTGKTIIELAKVERFTGDPATVFTAKPPT